MFDSNIDSCDHESTECMPVRNLDEILEKLPVGWFHYRLLIICGLSFMADGMVYIYYYVIFTYLTKEVSLLSFISTCAGMDWDLSGTQVALITSIVFAGELLGSIFFGPIADAYGRRQAFMICRGNFRCR